MCNTPWERLEVDLIVNVMHREVTGYGPTYAALAAAAGAEAFKEALDHLDHLMERDTGGLGITTAGRLRSKHVIHDVVGSNISTADHNTRRQFITHFVARALKFARMQGARTLAYPLYTPGPNFFPRRTCIAEMVLALFQGQIDPGDPMQRIYLQVLSVEAPGRDHVNDEPDEECMRASISVDLGALTGRARSSQTPRRWSPCRSRRSGSHPGSGSWASGCRRCLQGDRRVGGERPHDRRASHRAKMAALCGAN